MNKNKKFYIVLLIFIIMFTGCTQQPNSGIEDNQVKQDEILQDEPVKAQANAVTSIFSGENLSDDSINKIQKKCSDLGSLYKKIYLSAEKKPLSDWDNQKVISQESIDEIEEVLRKAGYPVLNSSSIYPAFLEHSENFYAFWQSVQNGVDAETSYWEVSDSGGLNYYEFQYTDGKAYSVNAFAQWDEDGQLKIDSAGRRNVLNWDMTYNGDFYYQDVPTDRHWEASILLRLKPVDKTLFDLNERYIKPIGYYNVNAFLCNWDTSDYGNLCFNDLFESLYKMENGDYIYTDHFEKEQYPYFHYCVPAELFENTILPYFEIPLDEFRERTLYNSEKDIYPWQDINVSNVSYFPAVISDVMESVENIDGSITLKVCVMCPDMQTDRLFTHEVTIMLSDGGKFKYLGNKITYTGENELPSSQPRISAQRTDASKSAG
jgi:hypothetical protein